jgi:hypothetical protein
MPRSIRCTFAAIIPEGYELMYYVNAANLEEGKQLVEGLAYFADKSAMVKYPAKLSIRDIRRRNWNYLPSQIG